MAHDEAHEGGPKPPFRVSQQEGSSFYHIDEVDWSEPYKLIGEFVSEFEKVTTQLRFAYNCLLQSNGLRRWDLGALILHIPSIGPRDLAVCFHGALKLCFPEEADLLKRANAIVSGVGKLVEMRNEIAHGEWHIGPEFTIVSDQPELPERMGIKRKISKDSVKVVELPTVTGFRQHIQLARDLVRAIQGVDGEARMIERRQPKG